MLLDVYVSNMYIFNITTYVIVTYVYVHVIVRVLKNSFAEGRVCRTRLSDVFSNNKSTCTYTKLVILLYNIRTKIVCGKMFWKIKPGSYFTSENLKYFIVCKIKLITK